MPRVPKPGDVINGYTITTHLNTGAMANAYAAMSRDGRKVFFKQYKSPSVAVEWYPEYLKHVQELNRRVQTKELQRFCVRNLDAFEFKFGGAVFFQVFEFIEGGHDLGTILERAAKKPKSLNWEQRLIMAKVIMAGMVQLHKNKIVHADLKPANIQMLDEPEIKVRYVPRFIDMDFSILADKTAPWDGQAAYVGSPRYFSPEHLRGEVPRIASDIFTCGIILYELLGNKHPFPADDDEIYKAVVLGDKSPLPKLLGTLTDDKANQLLLETLHRCLSSNMKNRPAAQEIVDALNARTGSTPPPDILRPIPTKLPVAPKPPVVPKLPVAPKPPAPVKPVEIPPPPPKPPVSRPVTTPTPPPKNEGGTKNALVLTSPATGKTLRVNVSTTIGKASLGIFGDHAQYADAEQFCLECQEGNWHLIPSKKPLNNPTVVNGKKVTSPVPLKDGDIIAIGSNKSDRTVLPLTVKLG